MRQGPGAYQVQLLGEGGEVRACRPGSPLEFRMFEMLVLGEAEWFGLGDDEAGESR